MSVKLPVIVATWKNFELGNFQQKLDESASEITDKQDESELSRKKLVDQLKEFKKNASEDTRNQASTLIKSFQNEVDFLNKRSKFAEASFLKVYQKILDIVDPTPSLEYCINIEKKIGRLEDLEIESRNLRETLKEYNEEFKEVKNQEVTIKSLKEKLKKFEEEFDISINSKSKELEKRFIDMYHDKEQLLLETHKHTLQKLHDSELLCRNYQRSIEQLQSELFEVKSKLEDKALAKAGEIEIIMNDLERANNHCSSTQKEVTRLKAMLDSKGASEDDTLNANKNAALREVSSLEAELMGKDNEISQLIEDVKHLQQNLDNVRDVTSQKITELKEENDHCKKHISNLEQKIILQKDYDEIKRELSIIKSVEFSSTDELGKNYSMLASKPLELLLLEKNKSLQNENTSLKLSNNSLTTEISDLEKQNTGLKQMTIEQANLITQLESDVMSLQSLAPLSQGKSGSPSQSEIISEAIKEVQKPPIPSLSIDKTSSPELYIEDSLEGHDVGTSMESLLPIVSSQRERFRRRNEELEVEITSRNAQINTLQSESDSMRADNIKLYEKIRFLQSYDRNKASSKSFAENRYSSQYESGLDPFLSFSQKEKQRRYASLSPFEKITLFLGKTILSNKTARTISFIYVSFLHIMVFLVLYKLAYTESWKRDLSSDCSKKFAEHMQEVHGNHDFIVQ